MTTMDTKVLIVDDSPILRLSMRRAVEQTGVEDGNILEAGNGREALELLATESVDLLLLDLHMPEMDGEAFVRALHEAGTIGDQLVIIVSTEANRSRIESLRSLGVHGYLHKPFEPEELREMTGNLLRKAS